MIEKHDLGMFGGTALFPPLEARILISEVERNVDPGYLGKYKNNGMPCSGSGGKPLTTRRHIDENKSMEKNPEVSNESAGCTDHEGLGDA